MNNASASKPNIVLLVIDFIRYNHFSFFNSVDTSPFIRKLSQESLFFDNAVTPSTWTYPTHASILTGFMPFEMQTDLYMKNQSYIDPEYWTAFQVLNELGYQTLLIGDNGGSILNPSTRYSLSRGLDFYDSWADEDSYSNLISDTEQKVFESESSGSCKKLSIAEFNKLIHLDEGENEVYPALYPIFEEGNYIEKRHQGMFRFFKEKHQKNKSFFLLYNLHYFVQYKMARNTIFKKWFLSYISANGKQELLSEILGQYDDFIFSDFESWKKENLEFLKFYLRFTVSFSDCVIQWLYTYIKNMNFPNDTIFMVTTDHGVTYTQHDGRPDGHGLTFPYECLVKTFLIINSMQGNYKAYSPERINILDIFLTLIHLADRKVYDEVVGQYNGMSLLERMRKTIFDPVVVSESIKGNKNGKHEDGTYPSRTYAFLKGDYKLLLNPTDDFCHLYNITEDPDENFKIDQDHSALKNELLHFAQKYIKRNKHDRIILSSHWVKEFRRERPDLTATEELINFFKNLGYIQ